jgi:rod shape determining protein RodA
MTAPRDFDWTVLLATIVLCAIGLALIYSVLQPIMGGYADEVSYGYLQRQVVWVAMGMLSMFVGFAVPFRWYETLALVIFAFCLVLLVAVLVVPSTRETQRWLVIGPLSIQPSEFTKVAVLFVWARMLSGHRRNPNRPKTLLLLLAVFAVPFLLVLKQPDLGTAIMFFGLLLPVMYWRGFRGIHILFVLSPVASAVLIIYGENVSHNPWPFGVFIVVIMVVAYLRRSRLIESLSLVVSNVGVGLALPVLWDDLRAYQQLRIINFLDPGADKLGAGWQVIQSKIAIGSGGLTGKGYLAGTQKALEFLPAKHTDFIFSVLGEEFGFVGALAVLLLFSVLIFKALVIAQKSRSEFASTVCVGIAAYFFLQVLINLAMTMGMAPVTGIPLPFISYGGSSMLVSCFLVGFLLNASTRWYEY